MLLRPIQYTDIEELPEDWKQQQYMPNLLHFSIQRGELQQGVVSLLNIGNRRCLAQLYIKPEFRGRTLTRSFWKQIYNIVFNTLNFKEFVAETSNPLMARILERENWQRIRENLYYTTIDRVRYIK